ncbi:hypothetical protein N8198_10175 [Gammaproteobacteria bacterium]|nr:hypothetical protein [Gammaproteobacteria bacterium]
MFIKRLFAFLFRPSAAGLTEPREAASLLAETQTRFNAEALALEAAQTANAATAAQRQASVVQQLTTAYEQTRSRTESLFSPCINRLRACLKQLIACTAPERLDAVERECQVKLVQLDAQFEPRLIAARRSERTRWWSLRTFQVENRLGREAQYPSSRMLHFGALAFVWLIESVANCWAFAQGSAFGLLGGLLQAMLVAAINLVFAYYAGRAASGLFHRKWRIKSVAACLVGIWVAFEVVFALTVAHYRIALIADVTTAPWMAIERLLTLTFAIDDVTSVLLTLFTGAFGVAALLTGLATDDRYPTFGARDRAHKRAAGFVESLHGHYLSAINAIFAPALAQLNAIAAKAADVWERYSQTIGKLKGASAALSHSLDEIDVAYREDLFTVHEIFARVGFPASSSGVPASFTSSHLLAQAEGSVDEAELALADVPARVARFEQQRTVAETRLQRHHAERLEAAPAFFKRTEVLAEQAVDEDDHDAVRAMQRQQSLFADSDKGDRQVAETPEKAPEDVAA